MCTRKFISREKRKFKLTTGTRSQNLCIFNRITKASMKKFLLTHALLNKYFIHLSSIILYQPQAPHLAGIPAHRRKKFLSCRRHPLVFFQSLVCSTMIFFHVNNFSVNFFKKIFFRNFFSPSEKYFLQ